jgi:hypothetical protein
MMLACVLFSVGLRSKATFLRQLKPPPQQQQQQQQ